MKLRRVLDGVQAKVNLKGKDDSSAFLAKADKGRKAYQTGGDRKGKKKENSTVREPFHNLCTIRHDQLELSFGKCRHLDKDCYNKERFANLLSSTKTVRVSAMVGEDTNMPQESWNLRSSVIS